MASAEAWLADPALLEGTLTCRVCGARVDPADIRWRRAIRDGRQVLEAECGVCEQRFVAGGEPQASLTQRR